MSISSLSVEAFAQQLQEAERTRVQVPRFSEQEPGLTVADAYAIQQAWIRSKLDTGRQVIGHKIGLTSRSMQRAAGISEPDFGVLLDDMVHWDGAEIDVGLFIEPRVEVELAFRLSTDLPARNCSILDVLAATDYVIPALEIIDARIHRFHPETKAPRKVTDTISDNAASAGMILGGRPVAPHEVDLRWIGALLYRDEVIEESGVAAAVMGHPARGIAWLADRLAEFGQPLRAGELVLAGSFTAPVPVEAGNTLHVDYGPLGSISTRFK